MSNTTQRTVTTAAAGVLALAMQGAGSTTAEAAKVKPPAISHAVTVSAIAGGYRIASTVSGSVTAEAQWQFIQVDSVDNHLGKSDIGMLSRRRPSVTSTLDVSCAAGGGGPWLVHVQVHGGSGASQLLFSDNEERTLAC